MSNAQSPTLQSSQADVWYLKQIAFQGKPLRIITQNFNGPCSFIAICNILILRGNIIIEPPTRATVSYEFLSQLVAEYLLKHSPNVDISDALSIMPHTQKGLDLNPLFTSPTSFLAATQTAGGELKLFSQVGIELVHGWLVDLESPEAMAMREEKTEDYDSAVSLIAEADHIADGMLVPNDGSDTAGSSSGRRDGEWTVVERRKIRNALIIRQFLEQTQSQLTYHGLFYLASTLPTGSLVALFRNSHLSVLFKAEAEDKWQALDDSALPNQATEDEPPVNSNILPEPSSPSLSPSRTPEGVPTPLELPDTDTHLALPSSTSGELGISSATPRPLDSSSQPQTSPSPPAQESSALYTLTTDQVFLNEPSVVWERIEDVDGSAGVFVDSKFVLASPAGGDWAGRTAEVVARDIQRAQEEVTRVAAGEGLSDHELARQLQAEEEHYARQEHDAYIRQQQREEERRQKELHLRAEEERKKLEKANKKKDCIIM